MALQPWDLLIGHNGHACIALKNIETLNPYASNVHGIAGLGAPHHLSDGYGMTSTAEPTRMHITIVNYHEYRDFPELRVREAKAYVRLFFENYDYYNPGTSNDSLGSYLTWTTSALQHQGHSECFNLCHVAPAFGSAFSIGPSSHYDGVVGGVQDRLFLFLDHVRSILGLSGRKSHYHISIRRA